MTTKRGSDMIIRRQKSLRANMQITFTNVDKKIGQGEMCAYDSAQKKTIISQRTRLSSRLTIFILVLKSSRRSQAFKKQTWMSFRRMPTVQTLQYLKEQLKLQSSTNEEYRSIENRGQKWRGISCSRLSRSVQRWILGIQRPSKKTVIIGLRYQRQSEGPLLPTVGRGNQTPAQSSAK